MTIKLAMVVQRYPGFGGAERYTESLAEALSARGYSMTVISLQAGILERPVRYKVEYCKKVAGIGSYEIWDRLGHVLKGGHFDLVHVNTYGYFHSDLTVALKRWCDYKVVFSGHGLTGLKATGIGGDSRRNRSWLSYMRLPYDQFLGRLEVVMADAVIAQGEDEMGLYKRLGCDPRRVFLCYPFAEEPYFDRRPNSLNGKILCVSRLAKGKGIERIIAAMKLLTEKRKEVRLEVVGNDEGDGQHLRQVARELGLETVVSFLPHLKREELLEISCQSDVFVNVSDAEGFNLSIANSLALGLPVICTDVGGGAEAVRKSGGGIVLKGKSPRDIAAALENILGDRESWEAMSQRGKKFAALNLRLDSFISRHVDIYDNLL